MVGEFSSSVLTFCAKSYSVSVPKLPSCVTAMACENPGNSAKSPGGRLHLNTHTPLTQRSQSGLAMLSRHTMGTYLGNELTSNSSGNTWLQSSQLTEPLWTDPYLKSVTGMHKVISTYKAQSGSEWSNLLPKSLQVRKMSYHHHHSCHEKKKNPHYLHNYSYCYSKRLSPL